MAKLFRSTANKIFTVLWSCSFFALCFGFRPAFADNPKSFRNHVELGRTANSKVDFSPYLLDLRERMKNAYLLARGSKVKLPDHSPKGPVIDFCINKDGKVSNLKLKNSCGIKELDDAGIKAVENTPMKPLPKGSDDHVNVEFSFDYR